MQLNALTLGQKKQTLIKKYLHFKATPSQAHRTNKT